jgi:FKBP-type peptidyl-prolyl cis-trans isomerase
MFVGEKSELCCSYHFAYGEDGLPPTIPPKATLIYTVELLECDGVRMAGPTDEEILL